MSADVQDMDAVPYYRATDVDPIVSSLAVLRDMAKQHVETFTLLAENAKLRAEILDGFIRDLKEARKRGAVLLEKPDLGEQFLEVKE